MSLNWDSIQGIAVGAGWACIRKVLEGGGDKGGEILLVRFKRRQRVNTSVLAIVRRDLLVEV